MPEDYTEPRCLLCEEPKNDAGEIIKPIPQQRVIEKMDEYMSRRDYAGAERHLLYWLEESKYCGDRRGELTVRNELVGHYRKVADKEKAVLHSKEALRLINELGYEGSISAGTTYTNIATAYNSFGDNENAIVFFEKAREVYENAPKTNPHLLGGLYNNMALALVDLKRFDEAFVLYDKAYAIMGSVSDGVLEQAMTLLNIANAVEYSVGLDKGEARIFKLLDDAYELFDKDIVPRDGYYAYVCEKCAPTFEYYGYFLAAKELSERAEKIYERT